MSKAERPWRDSVELAVKNLPDPIPRFENMPLGVRVQFFILRPKSVSKKKRYYPTVKPDLDKLQRSTFDGLTDSGIIADDSLIVNVEASKHYVSDSDEVGAYITIFPLPIPQD
jgi:Holliday junction resolvase RusA-like endonuclease